MSGYKREKKVCREKGLWEKGEERIKVIVTGPSSVIAELEFYSGVLPINKAPEKAGVVKYRIRDQNNKIQSQQKRGNDSEDRAS